MAVVHMSVCSPLHLHLSLCHNCEPAFNVLVLVLVVKVTHKFHHYLLWSVEKLLYFKFRIQGYNLKTNYLS